MRPPPARPPARRRARCRCPAGFPGAPPAPARLRPPGTRPCRPAGARRWAASSRRGRSAAGAGSGTRRSRVAGLPWGERAADLRFLDQMLSGGVPVPRSPSPAPQENLDSAASRHRLLSRVPARAGAIYSRSSATGHDARSAQKRCPCPGVPELRSPPSLGRESRGAGRSVRGLTQNSTGPQPAALRALRAGKPGRGSTG